MHCHGVYQGLQRTKSPLLSMPPTGPYTPITEEKQQVECGIEWKLKGGREVADRLMQELEVKKER